MPIPSTSLNERVYLLLQCWVWMRHFIDYDTRQNHHETPYREGLDTHRACLACRRDSHLDLQLGKRRQAAELAEHEKAGSCISNLGDGFIDIMIALTEVIVLELLHLGPRAVSDMTRRSPYQCSALGSAAYRLQQRGSVTMDRSGRSEGVYTIAEKGRAELEEWRDKVLPIFDRSDEDATD